LAGFSKAIKTNARTIKKIEEKKIVKIVYTNYRGETAERKIIPIELWFGSTEWHPEEQWLLKAFDLDKKAERNFALKDVKNLTLKRKAVLKIGS